MAIAKILVVEDERTVATDLKKRLTMLGYTVPATVSSGKAAIKKAAESHPDLVLMNMQLKGELDSFKAARQIHGLLDIPVVFLADEIDDPTARKSTAPDPFGYIPKSLLETKLHLGIETALYNHKMKKVRGLFSSR